MRGIASEGERQRVTELERRNVRGRARERVRFTVTVVCETKGLRGGVRENE